MNNVVDFAKAIETALATKYPDASHTGAGRQIIEHLVEILHPMRGNVAEATLRNLAGNILKEHLPDYTPWIDTLLALEPEPLAS